MRSTQPIKRLHPQNMDIVPKRDQTIKNNRGYTLPTTGKMNQVDIFHTKEDKTLNPPYTRIKLTNGFPST